jgi:hypothetical protein
MGLVDPFEALDRESQFGKIEKDWKQWEREKLMLGADIDHPDGVYAKSGGDMVCMTNEEFNHWYGGRSHSRGDEAGK